MLVSLLLTATLSQPLLPPSRLLSPNLTMRTDYIVTTSFCSFVSLYFSLFLFCFFVSPAFGALRLLTGAFLGFFRPFLSPSINGILLQKSRPAIGSPVPKVSVQRCSGGQERKQGREKWMKSHRVEKCTLHVEEKSRKLLRTSTYTVIHSTVLADTPEYLHFTSPA